MDNNIRKVKICHVVSVDMTLKFLLFPLLKFLQSGGYDVCAVCSPGKWINDLRNKGIKIKEINITRKLLTPFSDLVALIKLINYFKKEKFDIVHTHTPKAGLLGRIAAKTAGVPIIIHTNHGFYFQDDSSLIKKRFFIFLEKIGAKFSNVIFSINKEDIETAVREKICAREKIIYSGDGISTEIFNPANFSGEFIGDERKKIGVENDNRIIGFVGRLVKEKGILDLLEAFNIVKKQFPKIVLLIVGPAEPEKNDSINREMFNNSEIKDGVIFLGEKTNIERIYPLTDIFVLPSHREGLGLVLLEASAMEKPVIATDIRGCREAVDNGRTGILVPAKNPEKLAEAIGYFLSNPQKANDMGKNGRIRVVKEFDEKLIFDRIKECYQKLIKEKLDRRPKGYLSEKKFQRKIKRLFDFSVSLIGLILLLPVFIIVTVLIRLDSVGPIFFRQERVGQYGRFFKIWKFRTMVQGAEKIGLGYVVAKSDARITKIGKFLRRFAIDELPQFINIISGEMSLVGPRTALPHQVEKYSEFEKRRFEVKPGMASIAHIKGWNTLSWKERIKLDIWYIENWSIWLDFKILLKTAIVVLLGKGQYGESGVTKDYE